MVGRHGGSGQTQIPPRPTTTVNNNPVTTFISRLQQHAPNSTRFIGFLTLIISGVLLFLLTCVTITATILGLIFFSSLVVLSNPIWVPISRPGPWAKLTRLPKAPPKNSKKGGPPALLLWIMGYRIF